MLCPKVISPDTGQLERFAANVTRVNMLLGFVFLPVMPDSIAPKSKMLAAGKAKGIAIWLNHKAVWSSVQPQQLRLVICNIRYKGAACIKLLYFSRSTSFHFFQVFDRYVVNSQKMVIHFTCNSKNFATFGTAGQWIFVMFVLVMSGCISLWCIQLITSFTFCSTICSSHKVFQDIASGICKKWDTFSFGVLVNLFVFLYIQLIPLFLKSLIDILWTCKRCHGSEKGATTQKIS